MGVDVHAVPRVAWPARPCAEPSRARRRDHAVRWLAGHPYSTVAFSIARQPGGGIFINSGQVTVRGSIIAKNRSDFANVRNCSAPVVSNGHNLENGRTCGFAEPSDVRGDPRLRALANNGGPTNTHRLRAASPAIDAGGVVVPATDQRGVDRPRGLAGDIGAFER